MLLSSIPPSPRYDVCAQTHLMLKKKQRGVEGGGGSSIRVEVKERRRGRPMHDDLLDPTRFDMQGKKALALRKCEVQEDSMALSSALGALYLYSRSRPAPCNLRFFVVSPRITQQMTSLQGIGP